MDQATLLREQLEAAHAVMEVTMADVTPEQAAWLPPGRTNPLGPTYAHTVLSEDVWINGTIRGKPLLALTKFAGKAGVSRPPPPPGESWEEWGRLVKIDLEPLRVYARALYKSSTDFIGSLTPKDLDRPVNLSRLGLGSRPVSWVLGNISVAHVHTHCGEAACLKGLQGGRGYPF
jgi:hypothetical protein